MQLLDRCHHPGATPRQASCTRGARAVAIVIVLLTVLAAFGSADANAQRADPGVAPWVHESWTVRDGLPVNSIREIIQDRAGYIWAATFDGLVRFDGVRFTVYNSANSDELPSNRITTVTEARDGALWLTTEQGHVVRFRDGQFTNVPFDGGKPAAGLVNLRKDSAGVVWVGTPEGLWTVRRDRLVRVGRGVLDARVLTILARRDGTLWLGTSGAGVFRVARDGRLTRLAADPALDADAVVRMTEDVSGTVWIAGLHALWRWRERPVPVRAGPSPFLVENLVELPAAHTMLAATAAGVYRIDADSARLVQRLSSNFSLALWAEGDTIWTADGREVLRAGRPVATLPERVIVSASLFDREGSLWLGTDAGGLHRLKPALFRTLSLAEGVGHQNVYATFVDHSGAVWLGTWGKGASRVDPVTGRVSILGAGTDPSYVNSFYEDRSGALWIGAGVAGGLSRCTPPAMTCRAEGPPELRSRPVFALHGDADGRLWVGASGLLLRFDGQSWTNFSARSGAPEATVRAFATTRDGAVWMGTNGGGLARYREGTFTRVTRADGLPSDLIRSLYEDADGWLWIGTEGRGLARLDPRQWDGRAATKPAIVRVGTRDGLFDEVIHQILEDDRGRLWMNTNRGIFWVARAELNAFIERRVARIHSTSYSERDGMRNREGNGGVQPAGAKGLDGRLWFPTQDGVVVVDPAHLRRDQRPPPLVIEQVVAGGRPLRAARDSIALAPDQRDIQIEYTALTFLEPTNVRFRYRLDPYDASWVDAGNRRAAFYTKVPPGRYTFRVQASDAAGAWHEPGALLAVRVVPRFWETGVFLWALVLAFGVLVVAAVRTRTAGLRARALQLERVVDERTAALRARERELADRNERLQSVDHAKTRFFANVSHELRTPLTLTIGPLEDLRARAGGDPQVERWLDIALRNARRLLRLVNQILDVSKLEAGAMHLAPRPLDLGAFTRGVVAAFGPVAERNGIRLTVETPDALRGEFDADAVEKIVTNLLSNAIKFTPSGGAVHVALTQERASARLVVTDTGPGIPPDHIPHVFERFYQVDESATRAQPGTGIGLALAKELVELHGGTIAVTSGSEGTTFAATLPLGDAPAGVAVAPDFALATTFATAVATGAERGVAESFDDATGGEDVPTLLVVDDSADLRGYIRDHFAPRFRVLEAGDGAEGIALARRHLPDVVLSDVMMPGTDGYELVRVLRESVETDFLSIILLTAQAGDDQRLQGLERGADDYLVKPFDMRELDARVRNLIASRRRLRDRFARPAAAARSAGPVSADQAYVARVREAVQRGLADPAFGVGELADAVSQDRSHLFRRVKLLFGESPSDLIRRMRVEEGERLLADDSATVTDVAYAAGFNSLSYFCRCFQAVYGVTPAVYRSRASTASS